MGETSYLYQEVANCDIEKMVCSKLLLSLKQSKFE